jgi:diacylglycerol kinase family enzyme
MNNLRTCSGSFKALSRAIHKHTYPLLGAKAILSGAYDKMSIELTTDTHHELFVTGCVLVANQSILGGDLLVSHDSRNTDGMMEVMVLTDATKTGLAKALIEMRMGKVPSSAQIRKCRRARIKVMNHLSTTFFGDGETICNGSVFDLEVLPNSLFLIKGPLLSGAQ